MLISKQPQQQLRICNLIDSRWHDSHTQHLPSQRVFFLFQETGLFHSHTLCPRGMNRNPVDCCTLTGPRSVSHDFLVCQFTQHTFVKACGEICRQTRSLKHSPAKHQARHLGHCLHIQTMLTSPPTHPLSTNHLQVLTGLNGSSVLRSDGISPTHWQAGCACLRCSSTHHQMLPASRCSSSGGFVWGGGVGR